LTISGAINNGTNLLTLNGNGGTITVGGNIGSGTGGLTKTGGSAVILGGANTYSGMTNINGGALRITSSGNLGDGSVTNTIGINGGTLELTSGIVDLGANRTVTLNGAATLQSDQAALTISGAISGAQNVTIASNNNRSSRVILAGSNSYTGVTSMGFVTLDVTNANAIGTGNLTTTNNGQLNNISGTPLTFANGLTWAGGGAFQFNNAGDGDPNSFNNITFNGPVTQTTSQNTAVINGTVTLNGVISYGNFQARFGSANGANGTNGTFVLNGTNTGAGATVAMGGVNYTSSAGAYRRHGCGRKYQRVRGGCSAGRRHFLLAKQYAFDRSECAS